MSRIGFVRWLLPGLGVKRWLLVAILGVILLVNGFERYLVGEGLSLHVNEVVDGIVNDLFSPAYLSWVFMGLGAVMVFFGIWMWLRAIVRASLIGGSNRVVDTLIDMKLRQGYKIVALGGGTGLSTLLRGLKRYSANLTAVVTVSDDGGSSGRLQKELGVLPPGDVRNCLVALADDEAMVTDLFRYRFSEGEGLSGHSFGNLFLAAMTGITGNFDDAIKASSRVLNIVGRVLPSTLGIVRLCARLRDGTTIEGESNIGRAHAPIDHVYFEPPHAEPLAEVIEAIRDADAIVLGPGSLFTSIVPNLLVERVAREIAESSAVKMYVCNVMTQPGETDDMTASDHVRALFACAGERVCDYVLVNDEPPKKLAAAYAVEGQVPVEPDVDKIAALGLTPIRAQIISETENVRHDPEQLALEVIAIVNRAIARRATLVKPAEAYES
jgi:uncharacterized cofD-like protein